MGHGRSTPQTLGRWHPHRRSEGRPEAAIAQRPFMGESAGFSQVSQQQPSANGGGGVNRTIDRRRCTIDPSATRRQPVPMRKTSRWILNRFLFGLVGLPLAIAAVPAALAGGAESAARRQVRNARRLTTSSLTARPGGPARVVAHSAVAFVPALLSLLAALMMVYLVGAAFLYPLRPDAISTIGHPFTHDSTLNGSWGGTTLAGAWLAHAFIGVGLELLAVLVLWAASTVQLRLTRGLLRAAR